MAHPLYVAFIWHQHQPDYRDPFGGPALLPWVRLHAAKDYVHMAELVSDFPAIHCTFNFVPSLVDQVEAIGNGKYEDVWQRLSLQQNWTRQDKQFLLDNFFSIHPRLLERYPAYIRLRDRKQNPEALPNQYFSDLAAWFNLAWIEPRVLARDDTLRALVQKGENYSRDDIITIIAKHRELAARVIPLHRELASRGQIEVSVSPYYHPILPLLIDQRLARQNLPNLTLPVTLFAHPEDAAEQIRRAVLAHRARFGQDPIGLWPSEGSVCQELLSLLNGNFRWLATDENLLARSLKSAIERDQDGNVTNPRLLYQAYGCRPQASKSRNTAILFRDHVLSDRIGFAYQHLSAREAAQDLIRRLHVIRERIADSDHAYIVPIILDGENAWESYEDNGDPFFRELYTALSNDSWLRTVTVGEYLEENPPRKKLGELAAGSWINGNFDTWIGEPAHNRAWDLLAETREALTTWMRDYPLASEETLGRAWDELYIAEGSDWFWWYSSHNNSAQDRLFDQLFRGHLQMVYATIGLPVPASLKEPDRKSMQSLHTRGVVGMISPSLAADPRSVEEWNGAGVVAPESSGGTMQRADTKLTRLFFGYNIEELFFRIESGVDLTALRLIVYLSTPHTERYNTRPRGAEADYGISLAWEIAVDLSQPQGEHPVRVSRADGQQVWKEEPVGVRAAIRDRIVELGLLRRDLNIQAGDSIGVLAMLVAPQNHSRLDRLPSTGLQSFILGDLPSFR